MSIIAPPLVRTLVLAAMYVATLAIMAASGTTDPLGYGLLLFLAWVVVAGVWGIVDGARRPAGPSLVVWLLVAAAIGLVVVVGTMIIDGSDRLDGALDTVIFSVILIGVPAAIGVGIGALVRGARD